MGHKQVTFLRQLYQYTIDSNEFRSIQNERGDL